MLDTSSYEEFAIKENTRQSNDILLFNEYLNAKQTVGNDKTKRANSIQSKSRNKSHPDLLDDLNPNVILVR